MEPMDDVLGEQDGLVFLRKPPGLPVFPLHRDSSETDSLLRRLLFARPDLGRLAWPAGFEGGIAHRLDNATSGLVLACEHPRILQRLREDFAQKRLCKRYLFVSARQVEWDCNRVSAALAHDRRRRSRMTVQRGRNSPHRGRWLPAETELARVRGALWEATMRTGVMHQVRLHAAFAGLALVGDRLYGGGDAPQGMPPGVGFMLHHVGVEGPAWRSPELEPPAWWQGCLERLDYSSV